MTDTEINRDKDIDVIDLLEIFWDGKWFILFFIFITLLLTYSFNQIRSDKTFSATTEIKPIPSFEHDKYRLYNSYIKHIDSLNDKLNNQFTQDHIKFVDAFHYQLVEGFTPGVLFEIHPELLMELFIEQIQKGKLFEKAIKKFNLINKKDFIDELSYNEAVIELSSKIKVEPISLITGKDVREKVDYYFLTFNYNDKKKWMNALKFIVNEQNKEVEKIINLRVISTLDALKKDKKYKIEDINTKINNEILSYKNKMKNKINLLKEQAAIARELKIEKGFVTKSIVSNVTKETPDYLRGYKALEKEISLFQSRIDNEIFIPEITDLNQILLLLKNSKTIERAEELFLTTPIGKDNFRSVFVKIPSTKFSFKNNDIHYSISFLLGGFLGFIFAFLKNAFRKRKII